MRLHIRSIKVNLVQMNGTNAVAQDTCVPDPYANTNYVENFSQVTVVWSSLIGKTQGLEYACMGNQLQLMNNYTSGPIDGD